MTPTRFEFFTSLCIPLTARGGLELRGNQTAPMDPFGKAIRRCVIVLSCSACVADRLCAAPFHVLSPPGGQHSVSLAHVWPGYASIFSPPTTKTRTVSAALCCATSRCTMLLLDKCDDCSNNSPSTAACCQQLILTPLFAVHSVPESLTRDSRFGKKLQEHPSCWTINKEAVAKGIVVLGYLGTLPMELV